MSSPYGLRRYSSVSSLQPYSKARVVCKPSLRLFKSKRELPPPQQGRYYTPSLNKRLFLAKLYNPFKIPRNYSACDFNSQLQSSDRYKPKWSYTTPSYRTSWPYRTFRDHNLYCTSYYDKVYNYSPVYYRNLLHNSYQPKGQWYDRYTYPHQSSYANYKYPFNYSVHAPTTLKAIKRILEHILQVEKAM
uniref:Uncharacterized protein n=1 Tax=Ditylenchus dipsaci TaxID=166011 RepID=A0A915CXV9_9BILA